MNSSPSFVYDFHQLRSCMLIVDRSCCACTQNNVKAFVELGGKFDAGCVTEAAGTPTGAALVAYPQYVQARNIHTTLNEALFIRYIHVSNILLKILQFGGHARCRRRLRAQRVA